MEKSSNFAMLKSSPLVRRSAGHSLLLMAAAISVSAPCAGASTIAAPAVAAPSGLQIEFNLQ